MAVETSAAALRLLLVDDLALTRANLSGFLASQPDLEVVGQCGDAAEALEALERLRPDVVLIEQRLTGEAGRPFISCARQAGYEGRILVLAEPYHLEATLTVLQFGADAVFFKDNPPESLVKAIRFVAGGNAWLDPRVVRLLTERAYHADPVSFQLPLTDREQRVLRALSEGLTNRAIAERLGVSEGAVKASLRHLFRRLNVQNRSQLLRVALTGTRASGAPQV